MQGEGSRPPKALAVLRWAWGRLHARETAALREQVAEKAGALATEAAGHATVKKALAEAEGALVCERAGAEQREAQAFRKQSTADQGVPPEE